MLHAKCNWIKITKREYKFVGHNLTGDVGTFRGIGERDRGVKRLKMTSLYPVQIVNLLVLLLFQNSIIVRFGSHIIHLKYF
ncbi:hypothetical protein FKM82_006888 [Ascaphus truei]